MDTENFLQIRFTQAPLDSSHAAEYEPGQTLAQAVYLSGLAQPPALCSAMALCGLCRLRILADVPGALPEDRQIFTPAELQAGWRLGCRHRPFPGIKVELPPFVLPMELPPPVLSMGLSSSALPIKHPLTEQGHAQPANRRAISGTRTTSRADRSPALLSVDLGTTTLAWRLDTRPKSGQAADLNSGQDTVLNIVRGSSLDILKDICSATPQGREQISSACLAHGVMRNPQLGAGSDVISRLSAARTPRGKKALQELVRTALQGIVLELETSFPVTVQALCLAANPAMTALALGLQTDTLAQAPYSLPLSGGTWATLPGLPPAWIPPQLSPFVGGDISAGYAGIALAPDHVSPQTSSEFLVAQASYPFLLADLGTNGEFLLALSPQETITASVALGPALEGIGLSQGTEAKPGAISAFSLTPKGLQPFVLEDCSEMMASLKAERIEAPLPKGSVVENLSPDSEAPLPGITGTGYLSLLSLLIKTGAMDREGHFTLSSSPLLRRSLTLLPEQSRQGITLVLPQGHLLSATDVEEVLKVKAAFSLGLSRLLEHAEISSADLACVYVAGSLGRHADKEALETLGFFPPGLRTRIVCVGNASLTGAALLLQEPKIRESLCQWVTGVRNLDLAADPAFRNSFPKHMRFAW